MFNVRGTEQLSSIRISLAEYLLAVLMLTGGEIDKNVNSTHRFCVLWWLYPRFLGHTRVSKRIGQAQKKYVALWQSFTKIICEPIFLLLHSLHRYAAKPRTSGTHTHCFLLWLNLCLLFLSLKCEDSKTVTTYVSGQITKMHFLEIIKSRNCPWPSKR